MEGSLHKYHGDQMAGKGMKSFNHYNLVQKFISMPQAMHTSAAKSSSGQRMGKTLENTSMAADESQKQ